MLMRTDPFRELDRLTQQVFGPNSTRPSAMPMDAYRSGEDFLVHFDLPGIDPETIELDVERNVLSVRAERRGPAPEGAQVVVAERPTGTFTRQLFLGDTLDTDRIDASYEAGVLTLRIPVAEQAKPRRIQISGGDGSRKQISG
ncbi:Hsp20/alpha crystallin family protein [Streptomyces sp. 5-8]|uniref:Hsp20/alpha crystallin family protein n=1 Tax=Streptomyces musisoli TaxID=2802280 RepID=A0ABS1NZS4_9ACTN|nr:MULTISPECIES: Hsp20/alpha crystallin family protein [Streptomyces]MBL1105280.1 Hsp20/alpha crystallin family protein [Streptomyces musisoli]MBY8846802.1 Hsp20/alpha crystallin family protein [Streptomyces sp. SP2-10]